MRRLAALFALLALLAQDAGAAARGSVVLALPRAASAGEAVALQIRVGVIGRGAEIDVYSRQGALLGTISPFAIRGGHEAGTYTLPLEDSVTRGGRISVRLSLTRHGAAQRAPNAQEVRSVKLVFLDVTR